MLTNLSLFPITEVYLKAVEAGIVDIYCSNTGLVIGSFTGPEMHAAIEMEYELNPTASEDEILDSLQLALIPASSRASVLFQNMTPDRYRLLAKQKPEHLFRFLAGKLMFERWTHIHGLVKAGDKVEWLKTVSLAGVDPSRFQICLDTLIRIDAVFSVRQVTIDSELTQRVIQIREEWPGFDEFDSLVYGLEANNINKLKTFDPMNEGRVKGNKMAVPAMLDSIANYGTEEYTKAIEIRRQAEVLREMRAQNRAADEMRKVKRTYAKTISGGETQVKRGLDAAMSLAMLGDTFDKDLALKLIANYDSAEAARKRAAIAAGKYVPSQMKAKKEPGSNKGAGTAKASMNRTEQKYGTKINISINFGSTDLDL